MKCVPTLYLLLMICYIEDENSVTYQRVATIYFYKKFLNSPFDVALEIKYKRSR